MKTKRFTTLISLFLASCFCLTGCIFSSSSSSSEDGAIYNELGQIKTQISSSECEEKNYEKIIDKLKYAGFKNFKLNFVGDIILGLLAHEDEIDSISINNTNTFDKDSYFDVKSVVFINIHSRTKDCRIIQQEIDGQLPIFYTSNCFDGQDKLSTGEQLSNIGFSNVAYNPIQDCWSSSSWDYNDTDGFTVDGNSSFYEYSFFDVESNIRISYHTVEGDYCINGLEHACKDSPGVPPTCAEWGYTSGTYCTVCNKSFSGRYEIPPTGHNKIIDIEALEPTCTSEGHTEGAHCSTCNEILSVSNTLPINPENHVHVDITEAIEPTCISQGRTEGAFCNDCQTVLAQSELLPIDSNNHVHTHTIFGTKATCISTGISDGLYCDDCETIVEEQYVTPVDPNNHTNRITDPYVQPTETTPGKTRGEHCGDCGAIIVAQQVITWYPDISWMCSNDPNATQAQKFLNHYINDTISFDGWIYQIANYNGYSTIFNYYISGGNYVSFSQHNAIFYFEELSQADKLIKDILGKGRGTNVSVTCKVLSIYNSTYIKCKLTSITCR